MLGKLMRLHNTLTRSVDELQPVEPGRIKLYTCGPTVYRYSHIGNLRTFLLSDLVRRALAFEGYEVTQVLNITDVGHMTDDASGTGRDRMDVAVADEGLSPTEIAAKYTEAFLADIAMINMLSPSVLPKATDHIPQMQQLIERLLEKGHAYEIGGNVYYDVQSFPAYGALSGNTLDELRAGHRQELEIDPNKRFHADFALWKRAGTNRLMKWESPWGEGFPGWHVECSAMSMAYLGERFDLHTGGVDLIFPHHEDEIAQSDGAVGHRVISSWVHGGHLRLRDQKMAKSTGNILRIGELAEAGFDPLAYRLLMLQTRYRSEMDFTHDALVAAGTALARLRRRMADWGSSEPSVRLSSPAETLDRRFRDAVADDLDTPEAVVVTNAAATSPELPAGDKYLLLASWDAVLGLDLEREARRGFELTDEVRALIAERDLARANKDFGRSDELRDRLAGLGLEVMDTPDGTRVRPRP
jgi:cysteinyl-tRNA synthetase